MHKLLKVLTFMGAILALTFCAVACKTDDDDDPTVTPQKTAGSISYATTTVSKTTADGVFTNELTKTGDGTVTYASSKETVATVNEDGEVTIKGAGETTITATVADSGTYTYATKTASYTLTVTQASPLNLNLKTGSDINSILKSLCAGSGTDSSACTKFARSNTNNDKATLYLDTEEKYIPVWSEDTEVYYYVPDGCTPVMNEDSSKMFFGCMELTSLDVTGFDTSNVTNMSEMFAYCSLLASLDVTGFDTSKVTDMLGMFGSCSGLKSLDVTGFDTSNVKSMNNMFSGCSKLTSLDLSKFDTSNVTDMSVMFYGCEGLTIIYATDKFVTTSVTSGYYCFYNCSKLRGGAGTTYDYSRTSADYARIDGGTDAPGYFTQPIGSKSKPDAVGDIVFSDGSATPYTADLTEEQKSKAVAVIFYAGSASDTLGAKTLGVGLKNTGTDNTLAWAKNPDTDITAIQCTPVGEEAATATFSGDTDGSNNWQALCNVVNDEDTSGNYPAWEWVNAYATTTANLTGDYASGWYLPTVAELSMLYRVKDTVNSALEKAGGMKIIADEAYWSSSQDASTNRCAWIVWFNDGNLSYYNKRISKSVCTVRAF